MDSAALLHHLMHESCYSPVNTGFTVCKQHFSCHLCMNFPPSGSNIFLQVVHLTGWCNKEKQGVVAAGDETQGQREKWLVGAGGVLHNSWAIWKTELSSIHWIHSAGGKNLVGQCCSVLGSRAVAKELRALKSALVKDVPPK